MKLKLFKTIVLLLCFTAFSSAYQRNNYRQPNRKITRQSPSSRFKTPAPTPAARRGTCQKRNEIIPDLANPMAYKLCIMQRGNWIMYTYQCPPKSFFDEKRSRCVPGVLNVSPLTTVSSLHEPSEVPSEQPVLKNSSISKIEIQTETTNYSEATDSSSSSEELNEIFLTHPPEFTQKPITPPPYHPHLYTRPTYKTMRPFLGLTHRTRYTPVTSFPKMTTRRYSNPTIVQNPNDYQKLTTWQSFHKRTSTSTSAPMNDLNENLNNSTKLTNPLEFINPDDNLEANSFESEEKLTEGTVTEANHVTTTPSPSRWKPKANSEFPSRERFPGLRPSLP